MKKDSLRWLVFLLPLVALAPVIHRFIYPRYSDFSDLTISFYPNALQVHQAVFQDHTLPLWSDFLMAGSPLAADPMSGLWYLPTWLVNLFPSATSYNLVIIFHLILAGVGMSLFLKREGLSDFSAIVGGLVFELTPKIWAHMGAGHYTLTMAVCFTPWLLLAEKEFIRSGYSWKRLFFPGIVFGLILLANMVWGPYAVFLWIAYSLVAGYQHSKNQAAARSGRWFFKILGGGIAQLMLALMISAPIWLPLSELAPLSSRALMTLADRLVYSLPFPNLLNLLIPNIGGMQEWVVYLGVFPLFLIALALWRSKKGSLTLFWGLVAGGGLLFSLGSNIPLVSFVYHLPLFDLLRVPTKFYLLTCVAGAILCAHGFEILFKRSEKPIPAFNRFWTTLALFALSFSVGIPLVTHSWKMNFTWAIAAFGFSVLFLFLWSRLKLNPTMLGAVLVTLVCVDLLGINLMGLKFLSWNQVMSEGSEVAAFLDTQPGAYRVYTPSYTLPQQTAASHGIRLANAVNPLMLMSYVDFMASATGIPITHYSVTMPDFSTDSPSTDAAGYTPDASLLGLMNVRFIASEFDIAAQGLDLVKTLGTTRIYENQEWKPMAWVQPRTAPAGEEIQSTPVVTIHPNMFEMEVSGPGQLVFSEVYFPGWKLFVNGKEQPINIIQGIFMGANLIDGKASVKFLFQPTSVFLSLGLAALAWIGMAVYFFMAGKYAKR
jgi:hypothetical protein